MKITLAGKVALVTGGGAGIGRAIVQAFSELDGTIIVAEVNPEKCAELRAVLGPGDLVVQCDVTDEAQVAALAQQVQEKYGKLHVLVNNVGHHLGVFKPIIELTGEEWDAQHIVNLRHMFLVTRAMVPLMRAAGPGGSIINLSSIEGFRGCPYNVAYTTMKHAVTGFTRAMALELASDTIRVNLIAPETTNSEQVPLQFVIKPGMEADANRTIPLNRFGTPEDHAGAAVYLATDLSSWVSGTTMLVDGGGLAQGTFKRTPDGKWTVMPIVHESASY